MGAFWIEFRGRKAACVDAKNEAEAREEGAKHGEVSAVHVLPYHRSPGLNLTPDHWTMCHGGRECLGRTACPQRYACSE